MAARSVAPKPMSVGPPHDEAEPGDPVASYAMAVSDSPRAGEVLSSERMANAGTDAANDVVKNLSELIRLAAQASTRLEQAVITRPDNERRSTRASLHLQERLRLGARMLQAFQDQLARAEQTLINLRQAQQQLQAVADETVAKVRRELAASAQFASAQSQLAPSGLSNTAPVDVSELDRRVEMLHEILTQIASRVPVGETSVESSSQSAPVIEIKSHLGDIDVEGPFHFRAPRQAAR